MFVGSPGALHSAPMRTAARLLLLLVAATTAVAHAADDASEPPIAVNEPEGSKESAEPSLSRVTLTDGQVLIGEVVSESDDEIVLQLPSGAQLPIARNLIKDVEANQGAMVTVGGALWHADPNRTRYLYGPSAMMLRQGELSFSQKELLFSTVAYGVTDFLSVQVGTVLPAWFFGPSAFNLIAAVKVGTQVAPKFHLAGGAQILVVPFIPRSPAAGGMLFTTGTYGDGNMHFSLSAGVPFITGFGSTQVGQALFSLSGNVRVAKFVALISENWLIPDFTRGGFIAIPSFAVRLMGEHLAVDIGAILPFTHTGLSTGGIPIPWVDLTYNF